LKLETVIVDLMKFGALFSETRCMC